MQGKGMGLIYDRDLQNFNFRAENPHLSKGEYNGCGNVK